MSTVTGINVGANRQTIGEHKSNTAPMNLYDCVACNCGDIIKQDLKKHHQDHHPNIPIDQNIFQPVEFITTQRKIFECVACNARNIRENMKKYHHLNLHKDIPEGRNIYKLIEIQKKSVRKAAKVSYLTLAANSSQSALTASSQRADPSVGHKGDTMSSSLAASNETASNSSVNSEVPTFSYDSKQFDANVKQKEVLTRRATTEEPSQPMVLRNLSTTGIIKGLQTDQPKVITDIQKKGDDFDADSNKRKVLCNIQGVPMTNRQLKPHVFAHSKITAERNQTTNDSVRKDTVSDCLTHIISCQSKGRRFTRRAMANGQSSIYRQHVDEEHLKQNHTATSSPLIASWSNDERYTSLVDVQSLETDDSEVQSDIGKKSDKFEAHSDTSKLMSWVMPVNSVNQTVKQKVAAQKVENIEHMSSPKLSKRVNCQADGINEQNIMKHRTKEHSNIPTLDQIFEPSTKGQPIKCGVCSATMKPGRLEGHMRRVHPKIQTDDDKETSNFQSNYSVSDILEQNLMELHSQKREQILIENDQPQKINRFWTTTVHFYECKHCGDDSLLKYQLVSHSRERHENIRKIDYHMVDTLEQVHCLCRNSFWADKFVEHMRQDHPLVQYTCIGQNGQLIGKNTEPDIPNDQIKVFKCGACQADNISEKDLERHRLKRHTRMSPDDVSFELMPTMNKIRCEFCHMMVKKDQFENHMNLYHPRLKVVECVKIYKCDLCKTWSTGRSRKKEHARYHRDNGSDDNHFKLPCDTCGRRMCEGRKKKHRLKACLQHANKTNMFRVELRPKRKPQYIPSDDEDFECEFEPF